MYKNLKCFCRSLSKTANPTRLLMCQIGVETGKREFLCFQRQNYQPVLASSQWLFLEYVLVFCINFLSVLVYPICIFLFPSPHCPVSKNPIKIVHSNTKNCSIRIQTRSFHSPFSSDHSFIDQMLLDNKNNKIQIKFEMKLLYVIQIIIILLYVL